MKPDVPKLLEIVSSRLLFDVAPNVQPSYRQQSVGITGMLLTGEMLAAGPFLDGGPIAGIGVFPTDSATAQRRFESDPLVRGGQLSVETRMWWTAWGVMPPKPTIRVAQP